MENASAAYRDALARAARESLAHLERLDVAPVQSTVALEELRRRLGGSLPVRGTSPDEVVRDLVRGVEGGLLGSAGGRFYAWVVGGSVPAALAADWLTSAWDQNAALHATAPAAGVVEEVAGAWLKELLGLPPAASFALVSGCQMAHVTCLAAARHALLTARGWDPQRQGLYGAPPIRILSSAQRHGSFERAVRLLGLGDDRVESLAADERDRLLPAALAEALRREPEAPTIVLLQAGDINVGAFDPFAELVPPAKGAGAWVHVDGAFGLWAGASPRYRHLVEGVEGADSWATDGHKWLNVPFDCGYAFVADPAAHRGALSQRAAYLTHDADARDEMDWNPEWSRRARGFPTWAALRQLGRDGVADLVERCCRYARAIATGIGALDGAELLWEPTLNQGLVRFPDPRPGATDADHDRRTDAVTAAIRDTGEAFFSPTTWRGRRAMRVSVCGWQTDERDVARAVAAAERVLRGGV